MKNEELGKPSSFVLEKMKINIAERDKLARERESPLLKGTKCRVKGNRIR